MADISAFPTIRNVLVSGNNLLTREAGGTIKAGMAVAYADTGVENEVVAALLSTGATIGVALYDAVDGGQVSIASVGCEVYMSQNDDTATIDTGHFVTANANAVGGTVKELDPAIAAHTTTMTVIGITTSDFAAGGTGKVLLTLSPVFTAAS